jgi:hypothetical protein
MLLLWVYVHGTGGLSKPLVVTNAIALREHVWWSERTELVECGAVLDMCERRSVSPLRSFCGAKFVDRQVSRATVGKTTRRMLRKLLDCGTV